MSNLVEISEEDALLLVKGAKVSSVEQFPSDTIGSTIVRYSNGLVWVKYKRQNSNAYVNSWFAENRIVRSTPLSLTAKGEPFRGIPPANTGAISLTSNNPTDPYEADEEPLDLPPDLVAKPEPVETPVDYLYIKDIVAEKGIEDPAFKIALEDTRLEEIQLGIIRKEVYERAIQKVNDSTEQSGGRSRTARTRGKK